MRPLRRRQNCQPRGWLFAPRPRAVRHMLEMMADRLMRLLPMRVVRQFDRGMGKAAPLQILYLIGNHTAGA